jgi:prophage regulatory protein
MLPIKYKLPVWGTNFADDESVSDRPPLAFMMRSLPVRCKRTGRITLSPTLPNVSFNTTRSLDSCRAVSKALVAQHLLVSIALQDGNMAHREITPIKRTIRRDQLREMVPLADSTIYEMEQRGEFPRRFALSPRCVVWDLGEVEAWLAARRSTPPARAPHPDVRQRRTRPVKAPGRAAGAALKGE